MGMGNRAHIVTPSITARGLLNIAALAGLGPEPWLSRGPVRAGIGPGRPSKSRRRTARSAWPSPSVSPTRTSAPRSTRAARRRRRRSLAADPVESRVAAALDRIDRPQVDPVLRAREVRDRVGGGDPAVAVVEAEDVAAGAAGQVVGAAGRSARRPRCRPRARRHPTRRRGYRRPTRRRSRRRRRSRGPGRRRFRRRCGPPLPPSSRSSPPRPSSRLSASIAAAKWRGSGSGSPRRRRRCRRSRRRRRGPGRRRRSRRPPPAPQDKAERQRGAAAKADRVGGVRDGEPGRRDRAHLHRPAVGRRPGRERACRGVELDGRGAGVEVFQRARHRHDDPVRRVRVTLDVPKVHRRSRSCVVPDTGVAEMPSRTSRAARRGEGEHLVEHGVGAAGPSIISAERKAVRSAVVETTPLSPRGDQSAPVTSTSVPPSRW